jgi:hypothetical protein
MELAHPLQIMRTPAKPIHLENHVIEVKSVR